MNDAVRRFHALRGAPTPRLRALRRELSRELRDAPAQDVLSLARRLHAAGHRFPAAELILDHPAALASIGARELEEFGRGMAGWGDVDVFACLLAGPAWRDGQVADRVIRAWARRADRWWRRAALVATVAVSRAGDSRRTLAVCRLLVADRDDMVVKAMSWALRELAKRDAPAVRRFLADHAVAPRVLREVTNKLRTGLKNPRR